jgi:hypothetical protein
LVTGVSSVCFGVEADAAFSVAAGAANSQDKGDVNSSIVYGKLQLGQYREVLFSFLME